MAAASQPPQGRLVLTNGWLCPVTSLHFIIPDKNRHAFAREILRHLERTWRYLAHRSLLNEFHEPRDCQHTSLPMPARRSKRREPAFCSRTLRCVAICAKAYTGGRFAMRITLPWMPKTLCGFAITQHRYFNSVVHRVSSCQSVWNSPSRSTRSYLCAPKKSRWACRRLAGSRSRRRLSK